MQEAMINAQKEMQRLRGYFPFRVIWAAIHPETNEVITGATVTRRQVNDLMRKGYTGFII